MARWHSSVLALFLAASRGAEVAADEGGAAGTCQSGEACGVDSEEQSLLQLKRKAASLDSNEWMTCPIYVVTDMGFDDWGALSVLHAAGRDPKAILTTEGMMIPSTFSERFAELLASWGVDSPIYQGPDGCHHDCLNTSFIETVWGYRSQVHQFYSSAVKGGSYSGPTHLKPSSDAFPWTDGGIGPWCKDKYRLLILSPVSQYDFALWKDAGITRCISEVVLSGAHFGYTEGGRVMSLNDQSTWTQLIDLNGGILGTYNEQALNDQYNAKTLTDFGGSDESNLRELNVVSDALAASRSLGTTADRGVKVTIIPLEVESINRYGMQKIMDSDLKYSAELQASLTDTYIQNELCKSIEAKPGNPKGGMVHRMACVNEKGDKNQYTLDMDAIVASYFWKPELFEFKRRLVAFDELTGLTYSECSSVGRSVCQCQGTAKVLKCFWANLATDFDAIKWFHAIKDELIKLP